MYKLEQFTAGQIVEVTEAYAGSGAFRRDGAEGVYTVLRPMIDGADYYLAKGVHASVEAAMLKTRAANAPLPASWDVIVHFSRIKPVIGPRRPEQGPH